MNLVLLESSKERQILAAETPAAKHLRGVLKVREGAKFWCGVKNGPRGVATVESVSKDGEITFHVDWEQSSPAGLSLPSVRLIVGLSRPQTMKKILSFAAEVGCSEISVFVSENGDPAYAESSLWRASGEVEEILKKSIEQSCACFFPHVELFSDLKSALKNDTHENTNEGTIFALDVYEQSAKAFSDIDFKGAGKVALAIGSERGWTDKEREVLRSHGCEFAHLGARVLRVENAVFVSLSVALSKLGVWRARHVPLTTGADISHGLRCGQALH